LEKHLRLEGLRPKTIEAYAPGVRRIAARFDHSLEDLSAEQLTDYFSELLETHSWSALKLDLYGLKFFSTHVLHKPWVELDLIKPPRGQRLPDSVTVEELGLLVQSTRVLSYRSSTGHPHFGEAESGCPFLAFLFLLFLLFNLAQQFPPKIILL
jgi:integrase/recombinase XerD